MPQSSVANRKLLPLHSTTSLATTTKMPATAPATDDDDDDYLSEKFLTAATASTSSSTPNTYYERRRQANRESATKVEMNNRKNRSRKEIEEESRRQGLQKSLFDRAREEDEARAALTTPTPPLGSTNNKSTATKARTDTGASATGADSENEESSYALVKDPPPLMTSNKALGMMLKMGFKEGQPLGRQHSAGPSDSHSDDGKASPSPSSTDSLLGASTSNAPPKPRSPIIPARVTSPQLPSSSKPLTEPLPVDVWDGRKGIGLGRGKRSFKPDSDSLVGGRAPKLAKVDDDDPRSRLDEEAFRNRAKEEYEERRASGNLANARRTLIDLDEKKGVKFDILWIDPHNPSTVPKELQVRLQWIPDEDGDPRFLHGHDKSVNEANRSEADKLRERMIADALRPVRPLDDLTPEPSRPRPRPPEKKAPPKDFDIDVDDDMLEDTKIFLTLNACTRLRYTLEYLRTHHYHCFWCGTSYCSEQALKEKCPGEDETDHD